MSSVPLFGGDLLFAGVCLVSPFFTRTAGSFVWTCVLTVVFGIFSFEKGTETKMLAFFFLCCHHDLRIGIQTGGKGKLSPTGVKESGLPLKRRPQKRPLEPCEGVDKRRKLIFCLYHRQLGFCLRKFSVARLISSSLKARSGFVTVVGARITTVAFNSSFTRVIQ